MLNNVCKKFLSISQDFHTDLIVYLRTSPQVAFSRVQARSRGEENKISLEYIKDLHELHEDWLVRKTKFQVREVILYW